MWYEDYRFTSEDVEIDPEGLKYKDKIVPQGAQIKFRYLRGTFLYGVVAMNKKTGSVWIECREYTGRRPGKWRALPIDQFKQPVLPRKTRKRNV